MKFGSEKVRRKALAVKSMLPLGNFRTIGRLSSPSSCSGLIVSRKAKVLAIRSFSSGKVFSTSGMEGASTPASRAAPLLAASLANWIWRVKFAMP